MRAPVFAASFVGLRIRDGADSKEFGIRYEEVDYVHISGRGTVTRTTSAGLVGGGFGIQGALEGMALASVVNAVTRKTTSTTDTVIDFKAGVRRIVLRHNIFDPTYLRVLLAPSFDRIQKSKTAIPSSGSPTAHPPLRIVCGT